MGGLKTVKEKADKILSIVFEEFKTFFSELASPSLAPIIDNAVGGVIFYFLQGLTGLGPYVSATLPPVDALIMGLIAGIIAGLSYGFIGFPAALLLKRSKRFRECGNEYLKNILGCETTIIAATVILALVGTGWSLYKHGYYPPMLSERIMETIVMFSTFALIGPTVREIFKRGKRNFSQPFG